MTDADALTPDQARAILLNKAIHAIATLAQLRDVLTAQAKRQPNRHRTKETRRLVRGVNEKIAWFQRQAADLEAEIKTRTDIRTHRLTRARTRG